MILRCLWVQRKESYPGEFLPELLSVEDEVTRDENPDWFAEDCVAQLKTMGKLLAGSAIINIDLGPVESEIRRRCLGEGDSLRGTVL